MEFLELLNFYQLITKYMDLIEWHQSHKTLIQMRQDIPRENPPNMEDEKPNNSFSMIDRFCYQPKWHFSV